MLGFRKSVTVQSFWQPRLEGMFSGKDEPGWDSLKASFHDPALDAVEPKLFYTHIQAMTIEIVSIAVVQSWTTSEDAKISSTGFVYEFLEGRNRLDVDTLVGRYSSAFGSSMTDGIRAMAEFFSEQVCASRLAPSTIEELRTTLYLLVEQARNMVKFVKLVS